MQTGWLIDPLDGYRYYLDPQTGQMAMGWVNVDGIQYYFTESGGEYSGWKWDAVAGVWQYEFIGRRPTGAMEPDMKRNQLSDWYKTLVSQKIEKFSSLREQGKDNNRNLAFLVRF